MRKLTRWSTLATLCLLAALLLSACGGDATSTTAAPTLAPTVAATDAPTTAATLPATMAATMAPTDAATMAPTIAATMAATMAPTTAATAATTTVATTPATTGGSNWQGTITMYAQEYTPNAPDAKRPLKAFQTIADAYQQAHPGVKIQFITDKFDSWNDTVRVKAAAGEMYDVYWAQWSALNGSLPTGIAVDLAPYFKQKNPYIPAAATWGDAMNKTIIAETAAPSGASYNINGDFVATAFFYNKDMFQKAGISAVPTTWQELIAASQKLKDAGMTALVGVPNFSWMSRHFLSDFYAANYDQITGFDKQPGMSSLDEAVAIHKGIISTKDPRFMAWWPTLKQFTDFWTPDYLTQPLNNADQAQQDFVGGKAAMYYSGSWLPNQLADAGAPFQVGSFNFPKLDTQASQYATGASVSNAVGGPSAGFQYALATAQADKSLADPAKQAAVLDWMQYFGTPTNLQTIVNEDGSFIPTWPNTKANASSELLSAQADQPLRVIQVNLPLAADDNPVQTSFGLYLSGAMTLEEATAQVQTALDAAANDYAQKNNVNLDSY